MSDDLHWQDDAAVPRYRSSAAARMVNIPVATLRVWERRYRVVGPSQAPSGHRLYSSQDVRRLGLIKQLVDQGNGIGMLARLDTARLQAMEAGKREPSSSPKAMASSAKAKFQPVVIATLALAASISRGNAPASGLPSSRQPRPTRSTRSVVRPPSA